MQDFGIAGILGIRLVIIDEQLELRQELLVKDGVRLVLLFEDVGLDQLQNVPPHSLHRLYHRVV